MNVSNDREVMVFKNEDKYSVGISKKNQNGEYEKAYFPIQFNKDVELDNMTLIKIKNAFLSFYKWEYEGKKGTKFFIRCTDFEVAEKKETNPFANFGATTEVQSQFEITDEDLPF